MSAANGGPAFPELESSSTYSDDTTSYRSEGGMTLRDYFAAKAMPVLMANMVNPNADEVARWAYKHADAMIEARDAA